MELSALVCRYADRFAAPARGNHHVGSPLGAWLVLAPATLRFAHPHAVVATALGATPADHWHGLPVFAAWITDPDDADD